MDLRAVVTRGLAAGVARLVLLTLAAVGFMAMHGVAATDPAGAHHNPMSVSAAAMEHPCPSLADHAGLATPAPTPGAPLSVAPADCEGHGLMAACLFVLLSTLAGMALHALHGRLGATPPDPTRSGGEGYRRSRAPPKPIFLTLCVFRL